jgi:hypothetical protein
MSPRPLSPEPSAPQRARPKLDMSTTSAKPGERKKTRSLFGVLVGTLNKARVEDKERSATVAAQKRAMLDQRLQMKLRREKDSGRRADEVKKDRLGAGRREEELGIKQAAVCDFYIFQ